MRSGSIHVLLVVIIGVFGTSAARAGTLSGAGSTFIDPIMVKWIEAYSSVNPSQQVTYQAVGSLQGLDELVSHKVDFAASDAPLHPPQLSDPACQTLYFPATVGAVVAIYNLPKIPSTTRLKFTGPLLADIYLHKIKNWNDPKIEAVNPGVALPAREIVVVYRSDGSGTTYTFTDYLTKVSSEWMKRPGTGLVVEWPWGVPGRGNEGVAQTVRETGGAIGYVESTYAVTSALPFGLIQNRAGNWVDATAENITAAAESTIGAMSSDLRQSITDAPAPQAYPISSYSYLLSFQREGDPAKSAAFGKFVGWVLHDGQSYAHDLGYGAVPSKLLSLAADQISQIQLATGSTTQASCKATLGLVPHNESIPIVRHEEEEGYLSSD